jgi:hypothetical protein
MQTRLTREAFLAATALPTETVTIPELGGVIEMRGLSAATRDEFEKTMWEKKGKTRQLNMQNIRARLVAMCAVDEAGQRLFTEEDVAAIGEIRADVIDRLFSVAQRLSGLGDNDVEELGQPSA